MTEARRVLAVAGVPTLVVVYPEPGDDDAKVRVPCRGRSWIRAMWRRGGLERVDAGGDVP
jgi:hypothetical protein